MIRKVLGMLGGERGIRLLFQGNAVRCGPTQFPRLWGMHLENCTTFGWERVPELYVTQTPVFNSRRVRRGRSVRHRDSFLRLPSCSTRRNSAPSSRTNSGHVIKQPRCYSTIAAIMAMISLGVLPIPLELAVLPVRLAFLEWSRKSELSAGRAELLGSQDLAASMRMFAEDGAAVPARRTCGPATSTSNRSCAAGERVRHAT